jgi:hypothetical protein
VYITHNDWSSTSSSSSQIGLDQFTMLAMYNFGPMEEKDHISSITNRFIFIYTFLNNGSCEIDDVTIPFH